MQIKVIKKGENISQEKETTHPQPEKKVEKKLRKAERKVESNILTWISDFRERKNLEFAKTQVLLSSFR